MPEEIVSKEEIIKREKFIIQNIQHQLDSGVSRCVSCDEEAIKYHKSIIYHLGGKYEQ